MRDGSIELRKVRGEVNPADLFTKHLSSAERVESLLKLFNCTYESGRDEAAPLLRRDLDTHNRGILACELCYSPQDPVSYGGRTYPRAAGEEGDVPDAYPHPKDSLPHLLKGNLDVLFPLAVASEELAETEEVVDPLEERGVTIGEQVKN